MACVGEPLLSCDGKTAKQTKHGGKIQEKLWQRQHERNSDDNTTAQ